MLKSSLDRYFQMYQVNVSLFFYNVKFNFSYKPRDFLRNVVEFTQINCANERVVSKNYN